MMHGENDPQVPPADSAIFVEALREHHNAAAANLLTHCSITPLQDWIGYRTHVHRKHGDESTDSQAPHPGKRHHP
jgi:hypothetical protein